MKRFFVLMIIIGFLLGFTVSVTADSAGVRYEVKAHITYNSMTPEKMGKLVEKIGKEHGDACKVEFEVKKVGGEVWYILNNTVVMEGVDITTTTQSADE